MQKKIIIVVVIVLLLGVGAFFFMQNKSGSQPSVINTVKDAINKSVSMECNYTDEDGRVTKTYIKNGQVRADYTGKTAEQSGSMIVTNDKMYMWTGKEGYMYEIPKVTITPGAEKTMSQEPNKKDEFINEMDKYKDSCKNAMVSDAVFTPPSDVAFTDYSEMQKNMMPKTQSGNPAGMTEEEMNAYKQQYMNQMQQNAPDTTDSSESDQ